MSNKRPNVVLINFDDLGYGDVGALNPDAKVQTPHMDALAQVGMTFTDAHSSSAVCTPSRYSLLTGEYNWRSRLQSGVLWGYSPPLISPGQATIASVLAEAGYHTGCIGKWHLGLGWAYAEGFEPHDRIEKATPPIDFTAPLSSGPHTLGFDRSFIIPASLDMPPYCYVAGGQMVDAPTETIDTSSFPAYFRGGAIAPGFDHRNCLHRFTTEAEDFLNDHANKKEDQPFFLYFPAPSPHTPHMPRKPFVGKSQLGPYGDLIAESDDSVGRLLATLDRHGWTDNTLVIVTSDNGAHCRGNAMDYERDYGHRSNHHFRGQKSDAWDGGHRVPMIMRWPKGIVAGKPCDALVSQIDLLATVAELASGSTPTPEVGRDSVSLTRLFTGECEAQPRQDTVHHSVTGCFAIRESKWKLICSPGSGGWSMPDEEVADTMPRTQLYDMANDPEEKHNVVEAHPDVADRLRRRLDEIRR